MSILQSIIKFFMDNPVPQEETYKGPINFPHCPTCDVSLTEKRLSAISFFTCNECNGLWVSSENFPEFLKKEEDELAGLFTYTEENLNIRHKFMSPRDLRKCPICLHMMMNIQFDSSSGVWIDHCCFNHGIWLDAGEINLILQYRKLLKEHGGKIPGQIIGMTEDFKKEMENNVGGFKLDSEIKRIRH
jgi:Zn-finger nucleic acid-binding protein